MSSADARSGRARGGSVSAVSEAVLVVVRGAWKLSGKAGSAFSRLGFFALAKGWSRLGWPRKRRDTLRIDGYMAFEQVFLMDIKRDVYVKLQRWKENSKGKTALLIEGARRVGKSTIAEKFARENYRSYVIIDFATASKVIKDNFEDNLTNLDRFFQIISLEYGTRLFP